MDEWPVISAENFADLDQVKVDPNYHTDDPEEPAAVWAHADQVLQLLREQKPDQAGITMLHEEMIKQVSTVLLYQKVLEYSQKVEKIKNPLRKLHFYIILFPGEGKDNTGIKDLNDKVIGYTLSSEYVIKRQVEIQKLFAQPGDKFTLVGQNYKTANIIAEEANRNEFIKRLAQLDEKLRDILLDILPRAKKEAQNLPDVTKE